MTEAPLIRDAGPGDAARIAEMANALAAVTYGSPGVMTAAKVCDDLLGRTDLGLIVAELAGRAEGYALYTAAYETAFAAKGLYLSDLYVAAPHRQAGVARALIREIARRAAAGGAGFVWWVSGPKNAAANAAYDRWGASRDTMLCRAVYGPEFEALLDR